jgi:HAMP domain-containing protein/signal transduction histidine kinase/CheY-like chemotaxis protein
VAAGAKSGATRKSPATKKTSAAARAADQTNGGGRVDERALEDLVAALNKAADGDFGVRLRARRTDIVGDLQRAFNSLVERNQAMTRELDRVGRIVGREGRMTERASLANLGGDWEEGIESVNQLIDDLIRPSTEVALVMEAVARGDLTRKMAMTIEGQPVKGEFARIGTTVNTMVDQLSSFADEVTRVAREVGTEGQLGGQAQVKGVSGTWKDLTDSVNGMAGNLTTQVRQIAQVTTAVANGDLSQKITVDARGEILELKNTINTMVDQLSSFADEVTRVAREVGTDLQRAFNSLVERNQAMTRDLTDSVNGMATNLTDQVRQIAVVTTAVANGDLSQKITVETKGEVAELAETINGMVETLRTFADEVTRVARDVGTEGQLGGQADVPGAAGTWRDLTDSVNGMATNLTDQVRNIAQVTTAVANGDLSQKITVEARGEILELKRTMNTMVDQLSSFADEVTRVAREVGTEGVLGGQADVKGVSGTWRDLTESVNGMASNLTDQVRQIANVTTAVADGDLTQKVTVEARGEVAALADTINRMVDQLSSFAAEVTRVAREVGTEGVLGGQAEVAGVSGTWRDLTESVNGMASNLTDQVRSIAAVTTAVANGDLSGKITVEARGEVAALADTLNTMVDRLRSFAGEVTRVAREVGTEGKLGGQAEVEGVSGTWKALTESVNGMASNLTDQVRQIAQVTTAVADGDLTQKVTVEARGEVAALADTINRMVDQLSSFADEVTRVAREVGTEGQLGGQADVKGVSGTWRDLTESVNGMASNLTDQVRSIANVTKAVADGDLSQKVTVEARGEVAALADTINRMVDQLSSFAAEVTRVAREVGTEGQLGGQAEVEGVSGTWRDLTENVNQLAGNLTTQVRAIKDVSAAVTQGDLTRQITVEALGEVAELKDIVNQMIENLRVTTERNAQQDWLNSNLARISGLMQGQRDLNQVSRLIMSEVTPLVSAQHGAFFLNTHSTNGDSEPEDAELRLIASYGYKERKSLSNRFRQGEALVGQAALEAKPILITQAPDDYIKVTSGLGEASPRNIIVLPVLFEEQVMAVIELATLHDFSEVDQTFLEQLSETLGVVLNAIMANQRTEELLEQSQSLTRELQERQEELTSQQEALRRSNAELEEQAQSLKASEELLQTQQEELRQTNEELQEKAALLSQQNRDIELRNREIEEARSELEEQARQLEITSKYKSEFLANMSHELRTPLNSLLILSKLLADNPEHNLSERQVEFAQTIHQAGTDLLALISDILDLSKVEAGKMEVHPASLPLNQVRDYVDRAFRSVAEEKGLEFVVEVGEDAPQAVVTDEQRLQQVLRNLLSNAFKFTDSGSVELRMTKAEAPYAVAFTVKDTGIGIAADKLQLIFEAFQQADGTTSRKYGGTGLGLNISREIAKLLQGTIKVSSTPGEGSEFTLLLPAAIEPTPDEPDDDGASALRPAGPPVVLLPAAERVATAPGGDGDGMPGPISMIDAPSLAQPIDDREDLVAGDRVLLVVDPDEDAGKASAERARERGFKVVLARGGPAAMGLAHEYGPDAVLLDVDAEGRLLQTLKQEPRTRHLPVIAVGSPDGRQEALRCGAAAYLERPADAGELGAALGDLVSFLDRPTRHLLVVEDDDAERSAVCELVGGEGVEVTQAASSEEATAELERRVFDCIVLDLKLPKTQGFQLLETIKGDERHRDTPVIIHTGKALTRRDETKLQRYAETIIVKDAGSPERLLAETSLHLHRPESSLRDEDRRRLESMHQADAVLQGRTVLIVDDDVRNVFALTSALEARGMTVRFAENGREALEQLDADNAVDLILMDVMMPEMDGYETTRAVRQIPELENLPIIALTAKAMKGDREKSIESGASDYITKPVDVEQLLSLMRVWLYG